MLENVRTEGQDDDTTLDGMSQNSTFSNRDVSCECIDYSNCLIDIHIDSLFLIKELLTYGQYASNKKIQNI